MDITQYTGYFHDGTLINIEHIGNELNLFLESAEINPIEISDHLVLSKFNTLKGKLHIINVKKILIGNNEWKGKFNMKYQEGDILDLNIFEKKVHLLIEWRDPSFNLFTNEVSKIEIEAEKIDWEPIPDLEFK